MLISSLFWDVSALGMNGGKCGVDVAAVVTKGGLVWRINSPLSAVCEGCTKREASIGLEEDEEAAAEAAVVAAVTVSFVVTFAETSHSLLISANLCFSLEDGVSNW